MMAMRILCFLGWRGAFPAMPNDSTLPPDTYLFNEQTIVAPACQYSLTMQKDGNLVLYEGPRSYGRALWNSKTVGREGFAMMQADGNLVMYNWTGQSFWSSNTHGNPGARLVLQDDGNLVIYRGNTALWNSKTNQSKQGRQAP